VSTADDDATLVEALVAGDDRSKEVLYRRYVHYIAGMCTRLTRSTEAAEDITQDAFVLAFTKANTLRDAKAFRGWLATIAVREVRRYMMRERVRGFLGLRGGADAPLEDLGRDDLSAEARSDLAALDALLQTLPASERLAWMLRYVEDEPLEIVASACGCSLATAKRRIAAADAIIRQRVDFAEGGDS
jgi:RNA polymerase sigma-70 factor (ECF subfamily)